MEIKNKENENIPLIYNRNKSTGDLIEKENLNINNFIPDHRMEQYLSEYYNYFYSTKDTEKENSNLNVTTNIKNNYKNDASNLTKSKFYSIISPIENNKKINNNLNIPDDLLIEYNNRKRLDELRKKYLSNSSLHFLRKKDEIKINNNNNLKEENKENNYKKEDDLANVILDLKLKYDKLQDEFNILIEKKNNEDIINNKNRKEKDIYNNIYKNYLIEENTELKNINHNYESIIELLISYINETNKLYFNFEQIDYLNLKQNIYNKKTKCINELYDFLKKCKENLGNNISKNDCHYNKIKIEEKNIISPIKNFDKRDSKNLNKNKMRYTYSTKSFRSKCCNSSTNSIERIRSKTVNKIRNDKIKKTRINLVKKKYKK